MSNKDVSNMIRLGDKLKKYRMLKNKTQREIADKLKIPYSTYSNYENGNRIPNEITIENIAKELGISPFELLHDTYTTTFQELYPDDYKKAELDSFYNSMNQTGREKALDHVKDLAKVPEYQKEKDNVKP